MNPADLQQTGASVSTVALTALPFAVPVFGAIAYGMRRARRHTGAWRQVAAQHSPRSGGATADGLTPTHRGVNGTYRGRAVIASEQQGVVRIDVRAVNRARLLDEISARSPLPDAPWLSPVARQRLETISAWPSSRLRSPRSWMVHIQDRTVTLICGGVPPDPGPLNHLLDLACDLAEGVDNIASSAPAALRTRLAPY